MSKKTRRCKKITICCQKGGVSKTTSACVSAYHISQQHKVLVVDTDPQGNSTEMLTQIPISDFRRAVEYKGLMDAIIEKDPSIAIKELTPNLHILLGDERGGVFSRLLFDSEMMKQYQDQNTIIKELIQPIENDYDFIIFDTAPMLGDMLISCLAASDFAVALYEPSKFCYSAMFSLYETITGVQDSLNPNLKIAGIILNLIDSRRVDNKDFLTMIREHEILGPYCFKNTVTRSAAAGRLAYAGFFDNPEVNQGTKQFKPIIKELLERVKD